MKRPAWMFPGQGSQRAGMALDLDACRDLFEQAEKVVGPGLDSLSSSDPKPLWSPERLQPALFVTCVGAARALAANGVKPGGVAGHSLGEYAALVAAEAIDFADALEVVAERGRAMAAAAKTRGGGMAAIIGLERATIEEICEEIEGVWVANLNSPTQTVISGEDAPLAKAAEEALRAGATRAVRLDVPMAGHSPLMAPAAERVRAALEKVEITAPLAPFYSVADAAPHSDAGEIKDLLVAAVTSPVRFTDTVARMRKDGFAEFVEVGPGKVLRGLVRQIDPKISLSSVTEDAEAASLSGIANKDSQAVGHVRRRYA